MYYNTLQSRCTKIGTFNFRRTVHQQYTQNEMMLNGNGTVRIGGERVSVNRLVPRNGDGSLPATAAVEQQQQQQQQHQQL